MKRFILISILSLVAIVSANAQIAGGIRYKDIKGNYDARNYVAQPIDPYNVGWTGVFSFFVPGSGHFIMGEPLRGVGFLAGAGLCSYLISEEYNNLLDLIVVYDDGTAGFSDENAALGCVGLMALFGVVDLGIGIWSTIDAMKVAKKKNMYYQDMFGQRSSLELNLAPSFALTPVQGGNLQPTAGMSFTLNF